MIMKKSGYVCLIGPSNTGKSTLTNSLAGEKVAIISHKPQTTRFKIQAIVSSDHYQIVIMDTPGVFKPRTKLDQSMVQSAYQAIHEADLIYMVIDGTKAITPTVSHIYDFLHKHHLSCYAIINKIDKCTDEDIFPLLEKLSHYPLIKEVLMVSALKKTNMDYIKNHMATHLPTQDFLYDTDLLTTLEEKNFVAELTREAILTYIHQEIPYQCTITHDVWQETETLLRIYQTIHVDSDSQRKIIIGKQAQMLKKIGQYSRQQCENIYHKKVYLKLFVRVTKNWQDKAEFYL